MKNFTQKFIVDDSLFVLLIVLNLVSNYLGKIVFIQIYHPYVYLTRYAE